METTGRCYCGEIQYQFTGEPKMFSHCHCESCRRSHGAAFVSWISVDLNQFSITHGREFLKKYESSPGIHWQFCQNCGASIFQTTRHSPTIMYIVAASLNLPITKQAEGHYSYEEKVPWLNISDDLPKFLQKTSDILGKKP